MDFQLSYTYSCDFAPDYVQIGSFNRTYEFKYCDQDTPSTFISKQNMLWVFFKTGRWRNRGFLLYYKGMLYIVCKYYSLYGGFGKVVISNLKYILARSINVNM